MFKEALPARAQENLALLGQSGVLNKAYLAEGTAIALQLGHRISLDFDFFTVDDFVPQQFSLRLAVVGDYKSEQTSKGTVLGIFQGTKFSLFEYKYPLLYPCRDMLGVRVADLRDLAAMKIATIANRGYRRDFIDLYFLCREFSLKDALKFYNRKYGKLASNIIHIQKSLIYFVDAEADVMPQMLKKASWIDVKSFFEKEVKLSRLH